MVLSYRVEREWLLGVSNRSSRVGRLFYYIRVVWLDRGKEGRERERWLSFLLFILSFIMYN